MDKNFKLQPVEKVNPEIMQIGHYTLPEFAQNLDKMVSDPADHKIADNLIGFMLNSDNSPSEASAILATIQNSPSVSHETKDLAQKAYNKINLKNESSGTNIEKEKKQLFADQARAVAHDAFIEILSKYFHGIKIENLKSDQEVSDFLLKNYPDIITSIKIQDPENISIGDISLIDAMNKIEKNDPHGDYTFISKMLVGFISGTEIKDSFVDDEGHETDTENKKSAKKKRQDFIQKFRDGNGGPVQKLFDSNRFKLRNIRNTMGSGIYEKFEVDIPQNLSIQMEELYGEVYKAQEGTSKIAYDLMNYKEKQSVVDRADEISRKILEDILQKHLQ